MAPLPALCLLVLAAADARAADEYAVRLRLERAGEVRLHESHVRLGESYNTVLRSSGAKEESLIVNLMAAASEDAEDRVEVMYQLEWAAGGSVIQAQDVSEVAVGEEALLAAIPGEWRLHGSVVPLAAGDSCSPPPTGGGLLAELRVRQGGLERRVLRRTRPYVLSNMLFAARPDEPQFNVGLEIQPTGPGKPAVVRYAVDAGGRSLGGVTSRAEVPFGAETLIGGDGAPDGVWLSVSEVPVSKPPKASFPSVPDAKTGWLRHRAPGLAFLHPPAWSVEVSCGEDRAPRAWHLTDASLPEADRRAYWLQLYRVRDEPGTLAERAAKRRDGQAGAKPSSPVVVRPPGGECLLWRHALADPPSAHGLCDFADGARFQLDMLRPPAGPERFGDLKRLVESLRTAD